MSPRSAMFALGVRAGSALAEAASGMTSGLRRGLTRDGERMRILADIAAVADGSSPMQETGQAIANLLVPRVADVCVIDLVGGDGRMRRIAAALNGDPGLLATLSERLPTFVHEGESGYAAVPRTARHLRRIDDAVLRQQATGAEDLEFLRRLALDSAVTVPLFAGGGPIGALTLGTRRPSRPLAAGDDLVFAQTLAGRVALALANATLSRELSSTEQELETILASIDAAITVRDRNGRMIYANTAAALLYGLPDAAAVMAQPPGALMERFDVYSEEGEPLALGDMALAKVLAGEPPPPPLVYRNVVKATGAERWLLTKTTPVHDPDGAVVMAVSLVEDVTHSKRNEIAQRLLASTARALAEASDLDRTLQAVADAAVPGLADWAGVDLLDPSGRIRSVAIAHRDPAKVELGRRLRTQWPIAADGEDGIAAVLRTGEMQLIPEITDAMLVAGAVDEEHLRVLRAVGLNSTMITPIRAGERILGALSFVSSTSRRFDERDLQLALDLGRQAGIFINHAQLFAEQAHIAHTLQAGLVPGRLPEIDGWRLTSAYRAAGRANEVGGDFYDVVPCQDGWAAVIGDVVGKGAVAASLTALARHTLAAIIESTGDVAHAMRVLNRRLLERSREYDSLCTIAVVTVGPDERACLLSAGHPLPLLRRHGTVRAVGTVSPLLGYLSDVELRPVELQLRPGDELVLYTDGVLDAARDAERFGEARLIETIASLDPRRTATPAEQIVAAIDRFATGEQRDDIAVLHLAREGHPAGTPAVPIAIPAG